MTVSQGRPKGATIVRGLYGNAYLVLALASLCWSGNHLMGRAIAGHVPPLTITTLRWLLAARSEEHTSELQSRSDLVCRLLLEKKKKKHNKPMLQQRI